MTSNPLPTAETVAELRAINRNYELARGIHFAITSVADALEASQAREAAAEARVTALEAEKAGLVCERDELREIVNEQFGEELGGDKNLTPIRGSYHTFVSWELRRRARQALSRSSTEVKNDG